MISEVLDPAGKNVVVFGAGGAARAIAVEIASLKPAKITLVNPGHNGPGTIGRDYRVPLAAAICSFVNDFLTVEILQTLADSGVKFIALRCAGYNQVDLDACHKLGFRVARVPVGSKYGPA